MDENILVDIQVPAVSMHFDASIPLYAPAADILRHLIDWISQQLGLSLSDDGHFLCNARTGEILTGAECLYRSRILPGDHLILF